MMDNEIEEVFADLPVGSVVQKVDNGYEALYPDVPSSIIIAPTVRKAVLSLRQYLFMKNVIPAHGVCT
jgi:hypothetical protein